MTFLPATFHTTTCKRNNRVCITIHSLGVSYTYVYMLIHANLVWCGIEMHSTRCRICVELQQWNKDETQLKVIKILIADFMFVECPTDCGKCERKGDTDDVVCRECSAGYVKDGACERKNRCSYTIQFGVN